MTDRDPFAPDLEPLLAPLAAEPPCGPPVRYDPAFLALRQSRDEDDPTLPMREWERPLKKADWRAVANTCAGMLGSRSKDLQVAAWLCDAWTRQHLAEGFLAGAKLLHGLLERYWDEVHPRIEDGDADARVAPFFWMNEALPLTLKLHVPLMLLPDHKPPAVSLAEWEQVLTRSSARDRGEEDGLLTRDQLIALADERNQLRLIELEAVLQECIAAWDGLDRLLDQRLALEAPSLGRVSEVLRKMQRACVSLLDGRDPRHVAAPPAAEPAAEAAPPPEEPAMTAAIPSPSVPAEPAFVAAAGQPAGPISNRQEAYRMLEAAAAFLQKTEPHSPTPYLIKRAVSWGNMSLADLMQEILREEGDLTRYFSLLGMKSPRD